MDDPAIGGIRREPELPEHEEIAPERNPPVPSSRSPTKSLTMRCSVPLYCAGRYPAWRVRRPWIPVMASISE